MSHDSIVSHCADALDGAWFAAHGVDARDTTAAALGALGSLPAEQRDRLAVDVAKLLCGCNEGEAGSFTDSTGVSTFVHRSYGPCQLHRIQARMATNAVLAALSGGASNGQV